jgi:hypothetical protein
LPNLRGGEGPRRQPRIAEAELDLDDAVAPHPRAHGKHQLEEGELEMRDLQPLRRHGDLAVGGEAGPAKAATEGGFRLGSRNQQEGGAWILNMQTSSMNTLGQTHRTDSECDLIERSEEVWIQKRIGVPRNLADHGHIVTPRRTESLCE